MATRDRSRLRSTFSPRPWDGSIVRCSTGLVIDPTSPMLRRGGAVVVLSARERALVLLLARHPGRLITHDELGAHAWAEHIASHDSVASAVKRVRSRLRQLGVPADVLSTVRGLGYRWDPHRTSVPSTRLDEAG